LANWVAVSSVWRTCLPQKPVSSVDEAEGAQGVDVEAQRHSIALDHGLGSLDMGPGVFRTEGIGFRCGWRQPSFLARCMTVLTDTSTPCLLSRSRRAE
jgi:hypothetical protein